MSGAGKKLGAVTPLPAGAVTDYGKERRAQNPQCHFHEPHQCFTAGQARLKRDRDADNDRGIARQHDAVGAELRAERGKGGDEGAVIKTFSIFACRSDMML
jgi:hypothetical protein